MPVSLQPRTALQARSARHPNSSRPSQTFWCSLYAVAAPRSLQTKQLRRTNSLL